MTGTVFSVKRFAVHDGAGIRSTLFLKGCPLRCPWCQNPEGLERAVRLWHRPTACVACGTCAAVCPHCRKMRSRWSVRAGCPPTGSG